MISNQQSLIIGEHLSRIIGKLLSGNIPIL